MMKASYALPSSSSDLRRHLSSTNLVVTGSSTANQSLFSNPIHPLKIPISITNRSTRFLPAAKPVMAGEQTSAAAAAAERNVNTTMNLLFVEMGVGYDQHGQDITVAAMRACKDAISSNSIPAFRRGSIPGVSFEQMKLEIKLGVPRAVQQFLDIDRVKSVFPYGKIMNVDVVDGGLICSSGVQVEEMGDKNDDCYIVNAAVSAIDSGKDHDHVRVMSALCFYIGILVTREKRTGFLATNYERD